MRWGPTLAVRYLLRPAPDTAPAPQPADGRPGLPLDRGGPPPRARATSASSSASSATSTRRDDADRGHRRRVVGARRAAGAGRRAHDRAARRQHGRRASRGPRDRRAWPSTRGTRPTSSGRSATSTGRARRSTTPARRTGWATAGRRSCRCATRSPARRARKAFERREPVRASGTGCPVRSGLLNLEVVPLRAADATTCSTRSCARRRRRRAPCRRRRPTRSARRAHGGRLAATTSRRRAMGAVGATFGRNIRPRLPAGPVRRAEPDRGEPQLPDREQFMPARSLNMLAAAWIQFQVHDWVAHPRRKLGEDDVVVPLPGDMTWSNTPGGDAGAARCGSPATSPTPTAGATAMEPGLRQHDVALVGRLGGLRRRRRARPGQLREGAKLRLTPDGLPAGGPQRARDHRLQRELVARAEQPAHAVRPRAQPALRRAARALPGPERRADLPDGAADRVRADRQDPHRRVDAGDPRHHGHRRRAQGQLERPAGQRLADAARASG